MIASFGGGIGAENEEKTNYSKMKSKRQKKLK
jgi:hypothetical protein